MCLSNKEKKKGKKKQENYLLFPSPFVVRPSTLGRRRLKREKKTLHQLHIVRRKILTGIKELYSKTHKSI